MASSSATSPSHDPVDLHRACVATAEKLRSSCGSKGLRLGLFVRVGSGLHDGTRAMTDETKQFAALIRQHFPGSPFLTMALLDDPDLGLHKDLQNSWLPNLIVELRPSPGGGTWVECEQGKFALEDSEGTLRWGTLLSGAYQLSARASLHCSMRGVSPRLILVGWTSAAWICVPQTLRSELETLGFVWPTKDQCERAKHSLWSGSRLIQTALPFETTGTKRKQATAEPMTRPGSWTRELLLKKSGTITFPAELNCEDDPETAEPTRD